MNPVSFTLTPTSGKHSTKKTSQRILRAGKRRFIAQSVKSISAEADYRAQAMRLFPDIDDVFVGPISVDMIFAFAIPKSRKGVKPGDWFCQRPDAGNLAALLCDSLQGPLYDDDCQIVVERVTKVWGINTEVHVEIREVRP